MLAIFRETHRLLVQAGVLNGDRELAGQGGEQRLLVCLQTPAARQVDDEQADQLVPGAGSGTVTAASMPASETASRTPASAGSAAASGISSNGRG